MTKKEVVIKVKKMTKKEVYNLTNPQKSIWYMEEVYKGTSINNICTSGKIFGKINIDFLKQAINNVVKQNDSFRIHIIKQNNTVKQYISDFKPFDIDVINITSSDELRDQIRSVAGTFVYDWYAKAQNCKDVVRQFATNRYKQKFRSKAKEKVKKLSAEQAQKYLNECIDKYPLLGINILKGNE